jgi:hypothetical protein
MAVICCFQLITAAAKVFSLTLNSATSDIDTITAVTWQLLLLPADYCSSRAVSLTLNNATSDIDTITAVTWQLLLLPVDYCCNQGVSLTLNSATSDTSFKTIVGHFFSFFFEYLEKHTFLNKRKLF